MRQAIYDPNDLARHDGTVVNRKLADDTWGVYGPADVVVPGAVVEVLVAKTGRRVRKYVTEVVRTSTARGRKMAMARTGTAPDAERVTSAGGCQWRKTIDGQWVVIGPRDVVTAGATVTVVKRSGERQTVTLGRHVEHDVDDDGAPIAVAAPAPTATKATPTRRGGSCDECGRRSGRLVECHDSSGISGRCCPRCASMPDYMRSFA